MINFSFPDLLQIPIENRLNEAKIKAEEQLESILGGHTIDYSFNENRKRRDTDNNLELRSTNVTSVTAVNLPFESEIFLVTFE